MICSNPLYYLRTYFTNDTDINECSNSNGGCEHECQNLPGSFQCQCNAGYELEINNFNCRGKKS